MIANKKPPGVIIVFGDRDLREGLLDWKSSFAADGTGRFVIQLRTDILISSPVDFGANCQVLLAGPARSRDAYFTGLVHSASIAGDITTLEMRTPNQGFSEQRMSGMVLGAGTPRLELMWSFLRIAGLSEDQINIEGLSLPPPSPFEVSVPVNGLKVEAPLAIGEVTLVHDGPIPRSVDDLSGPGRDVVERFRDARCWAWVPVQASTLDDAERLGLEEIEGALAWLLLAARYSFSMTPAGQPLAFKRATNLLGRCSRGDVVHVRSMQSAHRWLRGLPWTLDSPPLSAENVRSLADVRPPGRSIDGRLWRAVTVWARAAEAASAVDQVSALWQALELYARSTPIPRMFSPEERDALRDRLGGDLSPEQQSRVSELIEHLNDPPLLVRLAEAVKGDGVPLTDEEFTLLRRTRAVRNDLEHGTAPTPPAIDDDLRRAVAISGRILSFAAARRS